MESLLFIKLEPMLITGVCAYTLDYEDGDAMEDEDDVTTDSGDESDDRFDSSNDDDDFEDEIMGDYDAADDFMT